MAIYLHRPGHPMANAQGMVDSRDLDQVDVLLAVCGPKRVDLVGDSHYDGLRSPVNGADISTRRRHRQHMKDNGLTMYSDYQSTWEKSGARRAAVKSGHFDQKERREAVEKAWYQVVEKGHKPKAPEPTDRATAKVEDRYVENPTSAVVSIPDSGKGPVKLTEAD